MQVTAARTAIQVRPELRARKAQRALAVLSVPSSLWTMARMGI